MYLSRFIQPIFVVPSTFPKQSTTEPVTGLGSTQVACKCLNANDLRQLIHSNITRRSSPKLNFQTKTLGLRTLFLFETPDAAQHNISGVIHELFTTRNPRIFNALHVVVEEELVRMRSQAQRIMLFALVADPHFEEVLREDIALEEKFVIVFQTIQRFAQAARNIRHAL